MDSQSRGDSRRGFLAKLGALATSGVTAPVLTAFVQAQPGGLAVPSRDLELAKGADELPPLPLVISSLSAPGPGFQRGDPIPAPHGRLTLWVDGEAWQIMAYRA